jgi:spore cortex biosynthesis protein YabQ
MTSLLLQIKAFVLTLLLGIITGGIFQYYQLTVRSARPGKYSLYLLDFILWLFLILLVFVSLLLINQGEMRVYVFIALLAGVLIYYRYLWPRLMLPLTHAGQSTVAGLGAIVNLLQKPIGLIKGYIKKRSKIEPPSDPPD